MMIHFKIVTRKYLLTDYYQHPYLRGPVNVKYAIAAIAHSHNIPQQEVSRITVENAIDFFKLEVES